MTHGIILTRSKYLKKYIPTESYTTIAGEDSASELMHYELSDIALDQRRRFRKIDRMLRGTY